jgi:5'-nucleotidase
VDEKRGNRLLILLTNDDGVYAPGLAALEKELLPFADVCLVAPATEQSGVGHSITFLNPLICHELYDGSRRRGWAVEGSPADCVKLGVVEFCPRRPDLVVSGINGGLNAGINVLYSGTVAAAIEGAFFRIPSIAVSLEYDEHAEFRVAAKIARHLIEQILDQRPLSPELYNVNIPTVAIRTPRGVRVVPMGVDQNGERLVKSVDPRGRTYYWSTSDPPLRREDQATDLSALQQGYVTLTPLQFDMTKHIRVAEMQNWKLDLQVGD